MGGRSVKAPVSAEVSTPIWCLALKHFSSNCWTPSRSFLPVTLLSSSLLYLSSALSPIPTNILFVVPASTLSLHFSFSPLILFSFYFPSKLFAATAYSKCFLVALSLLLFCPWRWLPWPILRLRLRVRDRSSMREALARSRGLQTRLDCGR